MSEDGGAVSPPRPSAGTLIRRARESAGLHIGALAVSLKVPVRKIEALEADRLAELPDAVFIRALASSICRTLKIDPAPVLASLPLASAPVLLAAGDSGMKASFESSKNGFRNALLEQLAKPFVILGCALVVGALAMWLAPDSGAPEVKVSAPDLAAETVHAVAIPAVVNPAQPAEGQSAAPAAAPQNVMPASAAAVPAATATMPVLTNSQSAGFSAPGFQPGGATVEPAPSSQPGIVQFNAKSPSWIEVTDAKGVVQLRKTLGQGESVQVSGILPLKVIVGRADVTSVLVRGSPFGLSAVSRDNVARFEVR